MIKKYSFELVKEFVERKNGTLVSDEYKNTKTKLIIKCNVCGNTWNPRFEKLLLGRWCPTCGAKRSSHKRRKYSHSFVQKHIDNLSGVLSSNYLGTVKSNIKIKCIKCQYVWITSFRKVLEGHWCPKCVGQSPWSEDEVKSVIKDMNCVLLSKYKKTSLKLEIHCYSCNKVWRTTFNKIQQKRRCPNCKISKSQMSLVSIIEEIYSSKAKIHINFKGFEWLMFNGNKQEIDIWVPKIKLAIEYDGEQHFKPVRFNGISKEKAKKLFDHTKKLDKNKNKLISNNTKDIKYFIRFSYKDNIIYHSIIKKLQSYQIPVEKIDG